MMIRMLCSQSSLIIDLELNMYLMILFNAITSDPTGVSLTSASDIRIKVKSHEYWRVSSKGQEP